MGRLTIKTLTAVSAVGAAVALAGCGGADAGDASASRASVPTARGAIELTDGRLGGAITLRAGARPRELAPGSRPDVILRDRDRPRRDGVGAGAACEGPSTTPSAATMPAVAAATLCLLNGERADHGLQPLTANPKLATAAGAYAQDLVDGSYFSHTGRDGSSLVDRIRRVSYIPGNAAWQIGENLAWGTGGLATPGAIMQAWMNSPGHRANILKPAYREVGLGIVPGNPAAHDGAGATYATAFGVIETPSAAASPASPAQTATTSKAARKATKTTRKRKRARRGARARTARKATTARQHGRGKGERKVRRHRGPKARISV